MPTNSDGKIFYGKEVSFGDCFIERDYYIAITRGNNSSNFIGYIENQIGCGVVTTGRIYDDGPDSSSQDDDITTIVLAAIIVPIVFILILIIVVFLVKENVAKNKKKNENVSRNDAVSTVQLE